MSKQVVIDVTMIDADDEQHVQTFVMKLPAELVPAKGQRVVKIEVREPTK